MVGHPAGGTSPGAVPRPSPASPHPHHPSPQSALEPSERIIDTIEPTTKCERLCVVHGLAESTFRSANGVSISSALRRLHLFDTLDTRELASDSPTVVLYEPTSLTIASAHGSSLRVWDAITGNIIRTFEALTPAAITGARFDVRGSKINVVDQAGNVGVFNYLNGVRMSALEPHTDEVSALSGSTADRCFVTASWDRTLRIYDEDIDAADGGGDNGVIREVVNAHSCDISNAALSQELSLVVSAGGDGTIRFWDFQTLALEATVQPPAAAEKAVVTSLAFLDPYPLLVAADTDGGVSLIPVRPHSRHSWYVVRTVPLLLLLVRVRPFYRCCHYSYSSCDRYFRPATATTAAAAAAAAATTTTR